MSVSFNAKVLSCLKYKGMPSKKLISSKVNFTHSTGFADRAGQSWKMTEKETESQKHATVCSLIDDPSKLEAMTVKEIRVVMKHAGIPVKGSKKDMLSSLTSYLENQGSVGKVPLPDMVPEIKNKLKKRKKGASSSEEFTFVSDTIEKKESRSRGKSLPSDGICLAKSARKKEKPPIESEITCKKKNSSSVMIASNIEVTTGSAVTEPWTILAHKKPQPDWVAYNPKLLRPPPLANYIKSAKLMSWNVNGLRALLKSNEFAILHQKENFDVLCLQETKMQEKDVEKIKNSLLDGYENSYWTCSSTKLGYSGTAIISRIKPISVSYGLGIVDHDGEGRLVTAEFENFYLLSGYVPNSGEGLRRLPYRINEWDPSLSNYMKNLEKLKPVILTGDLNCAHEDMDIYNPAGNRRSAGFTDEERESFQKNFLERGFIDTFRRQHPSVVGYTYYGYRHGGRKTNKGWRLDYFLVSESIADQVHDSYIVPEIGGSDHCPIGLILKL